MSIDAVIEAVIYKPDKHILTLRGRKPFPTAKRLDPPGRRILHITRNPEYIPHPGDEIWGNSHSCMIGKHEFRRIMQLWDGSEKVL